MALIAGTRLGPYDIQAPLGAGGMGEVYRAHDTRLKRAVAIKVLPQAVAEDPDRITRFEREAIALAALHHPHIASLFGMEEANGQHYLVMELVEGETLAEKLARLGTEGLPVDEAITIARQIADALEAAHERGIIHRDLKPANIKVTPDGVVKVLDFGLAKGTSNSDASPAALTNSPTLSIHATQAGVLLGTAAYMSPEQASGKVVDKRSDIWSYGVVLWEMFAGCRLFDGETLSHTLADVLRAPIDFGSLRPRTPRHICTLIRRCLERDLKKRLRDIGEARIALEEPATTDVTEAAPALTSAALHSARRVTRIAWGIVAMLAIATAVTSWLAFRPPVTIERPLSRFTLDLGKDAAIEPGGPSSTIVMSPDGRRLVFPVHGTNNLRALGTRLLSEDKVTVIPGTETGRDPFFSPDGQWVGFFTTDGKLKKTRVAGGGSPITICDAPQGRGGTWGDGGVIVASLNSRGGLSRISADGGEPQTLTTLEPNELSHRFPQFLTGSASVLFTANIAGSYDSGTIKSLSLATGRVTTVIHGGYSGRYVEGTKAGGHLLYVHDGTLLGVGFDPDRAQVSGVPTPLLTDVAANPVQGRGQFDLAQDGSFVYASGHFGGGWMFSWLDAAGKMTPLASKADDYVAVRVSPDGQKLATSIVGDIWVVDIRRDTLSRVTYTAQNSRDALWAPDGLHIAYQMRPQGVSEIWWTRADGGGEPQLLLKASAPGTVPMSFSPDGRRLLYFSTAPTDIFSLPIDMTDPDHPKAGTPEPFLKTQFKEAEPMFSPDGRWVAYQSDETGRDEIYVRPFPGPGAKVPVSAGGGVSARWSQTARELFFVGADGYIWVAPYSVSAAGMDVEKPKRWSDVPVTGSTSGSIGQDVAPDGKRFAVIRSATGDGGTINPVVYLSNFSDEIERRLGELTTR